MAAMGAAAAERAMAARVKAAAARVKEAVGRVAAEGRVAGGAATAAVGGREMAQGTA